MKNSWVLGLLVVVGCAKMDPKLLEGNWQVLQKDWRQNTASTQVQGTQQFSQTPEFYSFHNGSLSILKRSAATKAEPRESSNERARSAIYQIQDASLTLFHPTEGNRKQEFVIAELSDAALMLTSKPVSPESPIYTFRFRRVDASQMETTLYGESSESPSSDPFDLR